MFSIFSFSKNKLYPNGPLITMICKWHEKYSSLWEWGVPKIDKEDEMEAQTMICLAILPSFSHKEDLMKTQNMIHQALLHLD